MMSQWGDGLRDWLHVLMAAVSSPHRTAPLTSIKQVQAGQGSRRKHVTKSMLSLNIVAAWVCAMAAAGHPMPFGRPTGGCHDGRASHLRPQVSPQTCPRPAGLRNWLRICADVPTRRRPPFLVLDVGWLPGGSGSGAPVARKRHGTSGAPLTPTLWQRRWTCHTLLLHPALAQCRRL
jgi:hypothetical protein